jgi:hypothetical protein
MPTSASGKYFTIQGLEELNLFVKNLGPEMSKIFHEVTGKYAQSISTIMHSRVPVLTGYLKSTIGSAASPDMMELYVSAHYARHVNYGTSRMTGRPFFTAPVEEQTPLMINELNQRISLYIQSNVRK